MASVADTSFVSIEDSVYAAFTTLGFTNGYFLDQNGVEPPTPYCSIYLFNQMATGQAEESALINGNTYTTALVQQFTATARFVFTSKDMQANGNPALSAANQATAFLLTLRSRQGRMAFSDHGISVLQTNMVIRNQQQRENAIYSSYVIDVNIAYALQTDIEYDPIDRIEMVGEFHKTVIPPSGLFGVVEDIDALSLGDIDNPKQGGLLADKDELPITSTINIQF